MSSAPPFKRGDVLEVVRTNSFLWRPRVGALVIVRDVDEYHNSCTLDFIVDPYANSKLDKVWRAVGGWDRFKLITHAEDTDATG